MNELLQMSQFERILGLASAALRSIYEKGGRNPFHTD
jgi:hypothetical protein